MKMSQMGWVKQQLIERGEVSRNDALKNHITRLAALINNLKKAGWQIDSVERKTLFGNDWVYVKRSRPLHTVNEANEFLKSL